MIDQSWLTEDERLELQRALEQHRRNIEARIRRFNIVGRPCNEEWRVFVVERLLRDLGPK